MKAGGAHAQFVGLGGSFVLSSGTELVGSSPLFQQVLAVVDGVAGNDCIVLLEGESGTGKELLARRIHELSTRSQAPFIPVNCAGISESLFESQFYGHVKGSFTGASTDTLGMVRAAEGGTLLLDEVGELPPHLQPKLLRVLQEREVTPVGSAKPIPVNVRFIASTNRSLVKAVRDGAFRSDLYHRLNIVRIHVPPLRSRTEDITDLIDHFLATYARQYGKPARVLSKSLCESLMSYPWPGNVRELSAYIERLYAAEIPAVAPAMQAWEDGYRHHAGPPGAPADGRMPTDLPLPEPTAMPTGLPECSLAQAEMQAIVRALKLAGNNRTSAARLLDIHRSTLLRKMRHFGING